jgi:copper chaperone
MTNVVLQVPDISCGHCAKTITEALEHKPGVSTVRVDIPAKAVYLAYDDSVLSIADVSEALDEEGYEVAEVRRSQ